MAYIASFLIKKYHENGKKSERTGRNVLLKTMSWSSGLLAHIAFQPGQRNCICNQISLFCATVIAYQEQKVKPTPRWISHYTLKLSFLPHHIPLAIRTLLLLLFPFSSDEFFSFPAHITFPFTFSLSAPVNTSDRCPITTRLPFRAKLFPLLVKQDHSFKLTDSLTDNHSFLIALLDSSLKPHCTRPCQFLAGIPLSYSQKLQLFTHIPLAAGTVSLLTQKLAFPHSTVPPSNKQRREQTT